jgi:hypothetical protein
MRRPCTPPPGRRKPRRARSRFRCRKTGRRREVSSA